MRHRIIRVTDIDADGNPSEAVRHTLRNTVSLAGGQGLKLSAAVTGPTTTSIQSVVDRLEDLLEAPGVDKAQTDLLPTVVFEHVRVHPDGGASKGTKSVGIALTIEDNAGVGMYQTLLDNEGKWTLILRKE